MSGGGAFGYGQSKTRVEDTTPQEFQALRQPFANTIQKLLGKGLGKDRDPLAGIPEYQGDFAAPIGANEQAQLDKLAADGGTRNQLLEDTLGGKFVDPSSNPFLQDYIKAAQRQTAETYEQVLGRTLPGQFTQAGQRVGPGQSSPFDYAASQQATGFANALSDIATKISYDAYTGERSNQQQAIGLSQQEVQTGIQNLQAQALPRLIEQYGLDQGLAEFQRRSTELMQLIATLSGGMLSQQGTVNDQFNFDTSGGGGVMGGGAPSIGGGSSAAGGAPASSGGGGASPGFISSLFSAGG